MGKLRLRAGSRRARLSGFLVSMLVVLVLSAGALLSHYGWALFYPTNADGSLQHDGHPQHLKPPILQRLLLSLLYSHEDVQLGTKLHVRGEGNWDESCPLKFAKPSLEELRDQKAQSYLLGGKQKPKCKNCKANNPAVKTCFHQTNGTSCTATAQEEFRDNLLHLANLGEVGAYNTFADFLSMTPCDLFPYLRGRTLWLVGDKSMLELMQALQCFFLEFWDLQIRSLHSFVPKLLPAADGSDSKKLLQQLSSRGWCVQLSQETRMCYIEAMSGDDLVLEVLPGFPRVTASKQDDLMLLNFGNAYSEWEPYQAALDKMAHYVRTRGAELPFLIWPETSPQHYDSPNGDLLEPRASNDCKPIAGIQAAEGGQLETNLEWMRIITQGGWRNALAYSLMGDLRIPVVYAWNETLPLWQYHQAYQSDIRAGDCTLSCHPSTYQWIIFKLWKTLSWPWCRDQLFQNQPLPHPAPAA